MFDSASLCEPEGRTGDLPASVRVDARLMLGVHHQDGETRLNERREAGAFRFRFPRAHGRAPEAIIVNIAGGLAGGDNLRAEVRVAAKAELCVSSAAAERIYRSAGATTRLGVQLAVGEGATALWLPQETILHDGARVMRRFEVDLAASAELAFGEMLFLGRRAYGEGFSRGEIRESWRFRREGRLVLADESRIGAGFAGDVTLAAALGQHVALATLVFAHPDAARHLDALRACFEVGGPVEAGASDLGGLIVIRLASPDAALLRKVFLLLAARMAGFLGQPMPRALLN